MATLEDVYTELRQVYDPEIPVNILDLGLIYNVELTNNRCTVQMTLTSAACPEARTLPETVKRRLSEIEGLEECEVTVVWEPQWTPQKISPEGRRILGIEEPD
jgi:metal-sulfur cluster biosynthetic enzyme